MTAGLAETRARLARLPRAALWILAARFKTVSLSLMPVVAAGGLAAAEGRWRGDVALAAMAGAAAIQIGTNLWNDAADAVRGVDGDDRLGPPRMTALGLLDEASVRRGAAASFAVAIAAGLWLTLTGGWPVVAIGLVSLALGYLYSMGPFPISGLPVGEGLVVGFFGLVAVSGTAWLMGVAPLAPPTLATGLALGLPAAAVLLLNNHRDRAQDARAGRRTLAILIGPRASRLLYILLLAGALALAAGLQPGPLLLLPAALAVWLCHAMWHWPVSARLNRLLGQTAAFQGLLTLALVLG